MVVINSLANIIEYLVDNPKKLKPVPFMKIAKLEISYDVQTEGLYVLKLITNSKYLNENSFILKYAYDYQAIIDYLKENYQENITFVETTLVKEIADTKKYIKNNCSNFKDVLQLLNNAHNLYYDLALEAYSLNLEKPNLKYDVKTKIINLYDDTNLISSRNSIYKKK